VSVTTHPPATLGTFLEELLAKEAQVAAASRRGGFRG
jgi:hypothetical protein